MAFTFNAASYDGTAQGGQQLQNVGEFGATQLTFSKADGDDFDNFALEPGDGDGLLVDLGDGPQSFTVISSGTLTGTTNQNSLGDLENVSTDPSEVDYVTIELEDGTTFVFFPGFPDVTGQGSGNLRVDDSGDPIFVCFAAGTMIVTDRGEVAVEDLAVGDKVLTRDDGFQPIRWIGESRVRRSAASAPIRVRAGALGEGRPSRDLRVSPQHRVLLRDARLDLYFGVGEALVPAKQLVDGESIIQERDGPAVRYFHILFDTHQIVYSDGMPTESFHPGAWGLSTLGEETRAEVLALFPQLAEAPQSYGPAARLSLRPFEVAALRD